MQMQRCLMTAQDHESCGLYNAVAFQIIVFCNSFENRLLSVRKHYLKQYRSLLLWLIFLRQMKNNNHYKMNRYKKSDLFSTLKRAAKQLLQ